MVQRATQEQVRENFEDDVPLEANVVMAMRRASILVDRAYGSTLVDELTTLLEIDLACHFMVFTVGQSSIIKSERYAEGQVTYRDQPRGSMGLGLMETIYGRRALTMDISGKLSQLGKEQAQMAVLDD